MDEHRERHPSKRIWIGANNVASNDPCALCGRRTDPEIGPELMTCDCRLVCYDCGRRHRPELVDLLLQRRKQRDDWRRDNADAIAARDEWLTERRRTACRDWSSQDEYKFVSGVNPYETSPVALPPSDCLTEDEQTARLRYQGPRWPMSSRVDEIEAVWFDAMEVGVR